MQLFFAGVKSAPLGHAFQDFADFWAPWGLQRAAESDFWGALGAVAVFCPFSVEKEFRRNPPPIEEVFDPWASIPGLAQGSQGRSQGQAEGKASPRQGKAKARQRKQERLRSSGPVADKENAS